MRFLLIFALSFPLFYSCSPGLTLIGTEKYSNGTLKTELYGKVIRTRAPGFKWVYNEIYQYDSLNCLSYYERSKFLMSVYVLMDGGQTKGIRISKYYMKRKLVKKEKARNTSDIMYFPESRFPDFIKEE